MFTTKTFEEVERGNTELSARTESDIGGDCEKQALEFIKDCLKVSVNPICFCSFGKDSLVLLHLILRLKKIPIIYWREPFFQTKFSHAQKVAELWDLEIYDYPPTFIDYLQIDDYFDVYNFYFGGKNSYINLYTGTRDYKLEDKKYLCAIKDLINRPKISNYEFKWDCMFHGQKQIDPVYITEKINLPKVSLFGNGILTLPLRDWTNQNIWDYIHKYNLPYNKDRYFFKDENYNNDVIPACHNCLDYRNIDKKVFCPKQDKDVICNGKTKEQNMQFRNYLLNVTYNKEKDKRTY